MERKISVPPTEMTRPVKEDYPKKGGPKYSGRIEQKRAVQFDF